MSRRGFDRGFALRVLLALAIGAVSGVLMATLRGYPPRLALLAGLTIAVLAYVAIQTVERLWRLWRRPSQ